MTEKPNQNPNDVIGALKTYKTEKMPTLFDAIIQEKNRVTVLSAHIKAKRVELQVIADEKAMASLTVQAEEQSTPQKQEPAPVVEKEIQKETSPATQDEQVEVSTPIEVVKTVEPTPEVSKVEEVPQEVATPAQPKPQKDNAKTEKYDVAKKTEIKEKPAGAEKPVKTERTAKVEKPAKAEKLALPEKTDRPQIVTTDELNPDGTKRRIFIDAAPVKKKPVETTRVWPGGYDARGSARNARQANMQQSGAPQQNRFQRPSAVTVAPPPQFPPKPAAQTKAKGGKQQGTSNNKYDDRNALNKRALLKKGFIVDPSKMAIDDEYDPKWRTAKNKLKNQRGGGVITIEHAIITIDPVPIKVLSEKIGKTAAEIIRTLFVLGIIKTINESIDFDTAELVTSELSKDNPITLEYKPEETFEEVLSAKQVAAELDSEQLVARPPIVTIMGHVDHGKTSLLDYIRHSNITGGEAGGITQHIGAYTVSLKGNQITFLDTPGHEAFTSMRARGAQVTDIAILVVAADDGIMPQTIEAIHHAKQANVPIIVAVNKMDKPTANPERVLQQLTEHEILPEDWGGDTPVVKVSAKTGEGVEDLLANILTMAEMRELTANPDRNAIGTIIEARLDKGMGKTATVLVQTGTLHLGDFIVAGTCTGKVRAMVDDKGKKVTKAGPSKPVSVTGWDEMLPEAGDRLEVVSNEKFANDLVEERRLKAGKTEDGSSSVSLSDLFEKISKGELKSVKLIVKADVQGSLEAVKQSLTKLGNEEVGVDIILGGVGGINESDVTLADTSKAIIIGFNVRPDSNARLLAQQKKIDIRFYDIIYNAIEDIEAAVKGLLAPKFMENVLGSAEVRNVFKITGVGAIAGCYVLDGKVQRGAKARLLRGGKVEVTTDIDSLRHEKDDVKEMAKGYECGIMLKNYQDVKVGDVIEAFVMEQI